MAGGGGVRLTGVGKCRCLALLSKTSWAGACLRISCSFLRAGLLLRVSCGDKTHLSRHSWMVQTWKLNNPRSVTS